MNKINVHLDYKWKNYRDYSRLIKELIGDIDFNNKTILDIKCGCGDIIPFITSKSDTFRYIGLDSDEYFLNQASKHYPNYIFEKRDYVNDLLNSNFDIIIAFNALNLKEKDGGMFRRSRIKYMYEHSKYAFVFNMSGNNPQPENKVSSNIFYVDSLEILSYCLTLTSKVIFRQNYDNKEFSIIMFK